MKDNQELKQAIWAELDKALTVGTPTRNSVKDLEPHLKARGLHGEVVMTALYTICHIYKHTANATARYKRQSEGADHRLWWRYSALQDPSSRASHLTLNCKVFRYDNPIWDSIYPPNGFNYRCMVVTMSERQVRERGTEVVQGTATESIDQRIRVDKATGETLHRPGRRVSWKDKHGTEHFFQPDPGWAFNPDIVPVDLDWMFDTLFGSLTGE